MNKGSNVTSYMSVNTMYVGDGCYMSVNTMVARG